MDFEKWPGLANIQNYEEENSSQSSEPGYVNSYLLWSDEKKEAVLFDPGWKATKILAFLESKNLKLSQIFLTHSHRDHIQAKAELQQLFPEASFFDYNFYKDFASIPKQSFGPLSIQPCLAPGHSADHVVYRVDGFKGHSNMALIVGDCLFSGSLGYPFHNRNQLLETLRKQVFSLPPETLLCPGHGPLTILQTELDHNPFASHNSLKTDT
ncbi:MAG: MBL fold metallo-hydrolase [Verrucomicrobiota bacterium]|nr:MBL fold metallo-hydrolase [Verrucomicrobiota bacterium]